MVNYNLSGIDSASNFYEVFNAVSQWHGGMFPIVFIGCIYFIILMTLRQYSFQEVNVLASFVSMFFAIVFGALGLISWLIVSIPIIIFIISMFILMFLR